MDEQTQESIKLARELRQKAIQLEMIADEMERVNRAMKKDEITPETIIGNKNIYGEGR